MEKQETKNKKGIAVLPVVLIAEGVLILILTLTVFIPHFKNDEKIKLALQEKTTALEEKQKDIENLTSQVENLSRERDSINKKVNTLVNQVQDLKNEINVLRSENEKLIQEKETLVKSLQEKEKKQHGKPGEIKKKSDVAKANVKTPQKGKVPAKKSQPQSEKSKVPQWKPRYTGGKG